MTLYIGSAPMGASARNWRSTPFIVNSPFGGHNPPYRVCSTGEISVIPEPGGIVAGLPPSDEVQYATGYLRLHTNDAIFLYTGGVTEAMKSEGRFFGERAPRCKFAECAGFSAQDMAKSILAAVAEFTQSAVQSGDITTMAVKWTPR